ncbi:uncharacterized protein isoform X2 [Rhodnius prolixus]|uniref:uncharacterized protein isoform X2 n=1 Tax=Rhodnius prolixus TaxID=13249 RepID=UPI003D18D223
MKMVIFQCALISYMYLLNIAYSQDETNVEESSENSTDVLVLVQESNFSIPFFDMSDTNETYESSPDCLLFIEENGSNVVTNRTKEELTQDNIPYFELCGGVGRMGFKTLSSLTSG